ncbi:MAG TPA: CsgG/HfaB family protein [Rudaea sp.]|nr:CsgG/HfaB family protein [Rudaea sp.]
MKHRLAMTCWKHALPLALLALTGAGHAADAARPVLAVLKFQDESGAMPLQGGVGRVLTNIIGTELAARDAFTVVERRKLAAVLEEQDLAQSGRLKPGEGARIGQLTGAQYLVMGTITAYEDNEKTQVSGGGMFRKTKVQNVSEGAYLAVDLRVVDTTTGEVAFARTIEGRTEAYKIDLDSPHAAYSEMEKPGEARAVRAAALEIIDYLECAMVRKDACLERFAEADRRRVDTTKKSIKVDGSKP